MPTFNFESFFGLFNQFTAGGDVPILGIVDGVLTAVDVAAPGTADALKASAVQDTLSSLLDDYPEIARILHTGDPLEGPRLQQFNALLAEANSVSSVQEHLIKQVNALRSAVELRGVTYAGGVFATDASARADYALLAFEATEDVGFTVRLRASTGLIDLSAGEVRDLVRAIAQHIAEARTREADLTDAIHAASTVPSLNAIDITVGWPG